MSAKLVVCQHLVIIKFKLTIFFVVADMRQYSAEKCPIANIVIVVRAALCLVILAGKLGKLEEFMKIWRNLGK